MTNEFEKRIGLLGHVGSQKGGSNQQKRAFKIFKSRSHLL